MFIKLFCPAKINLFLEVLDRRPDMYHDLDTVMQSVNLCDTVGVTVEENGNDINRITVKCDREGVPTDERNIAYKAADAFMRHFGKTGYDITVDIEKKIPVEAGLAGGSADCAGVLTALEHLFELKDHHKETLEIGGKLGADVPFCMTCGSAHCTGIGDILSPLPSVTPDFTFVVAKAGQGVSTKEAYTYMDGRSEKKSSAALINCLRSGDVYAMCGELYNAFEGVVCPERPMVQKAKDTMIEYGAIGSLMSGSGPSVFGIFSDTDSAEGARDRLAEMGYEAFVCFPVM